jgi:hypothetical protein
MTQEAMKQALEALELALRSHGVMLLSDPPQDAWKTYGVEGNARQAIASLRQAIAELESQEPVAYVKTVIEALYENSDPVSVEAAELLERITTPPQRTWVGLTDEEHHEIVLFAESGDWHDFEVINATEAKLKQLNT